MRWSVPLSLLAGTIAAAALACGDSGGPNPSAASITGIAGDGQSAALGTAVPFPLSFTALGSNGQPVQGVAVNWTVTPVGAATFIPQSSTTSAAGIASTNVTVGSVAGDLTIHANVAGVSPVVFHVEAVNPCAFLVAYTIGTTANGQLSSGDCRLGGNYYTDFYEFTVGAQQAITATMTAPTFNAWLDAYRANGRQMGAANDIAPGNTDARLELIVAPGTYVFAPNSFSEFSVGAYSLTSATQTNGVTGCGEVWVTRGITITDSLAAGDCVDSTATSFFYSDLIGVIAFANDTIRLTQRSTAIDPYLTVFRVDPTGFVTVASNDDSTATTTDAFINYPVLTTAVYVVSVSSVDTLDTGAYTLTVGGSASLGPTPLLPTAAMRFSRGRGAFGMATLPKRARLR